MRNHWFVVCASAAVAATMFLMACDHPANRGLPSLNADYHAVFMQNGQVFFGRIDVPSGDYVTLREVYYIQQQINPETKQVSNVLLKRSGELHAPDVMHINGRQIALIEPVTAESRVAQLIKQAVGAQRPPTGM